MKRIMETIGTALAKQFGITEGKLKAKYSKSKMNPEDYANMLGIDNDTIKAFSEKVSTDSGDSFISSSSDKDTEATSYLTNFDDNDHNEYFSLDDAEYDANAAEETEEADEADEADEDSAAKSKKSKKSKKTNKTDKTDNSNKTNNSNKSDKTDNDNSEEKTQKDKYKEVAEATGYDRKSVSAVMKAIANGETAGMAPEKVVSELAKKLGLTEKLVAAVLGYLNGGQI